METPALVLVPSSPLKPNTTSPSPALSSKSNSPVSSDSSHTSPPSSYGITIEKDDESTRNSSESTIFSIYSMYSERRQTWRKSSNLANNVLIGYKERERDGSRESGKDGGADEGSLGAGSLLNGSIENSFYRGQQAGMGTRSVSRQSSSGSGFFAGSAESSSRHQSYNYHYSYTISTSAGASPPHSRPQSRSATASRHANSFLDTTQNIKLDLNHAGAESTELPYATRPLSISNVDEEADTQTSSAVNSRPDEGATAWRNYVDLTQTDSSQPDLSMQRHSPASGRIHSSSSRPASVDNDHLNEMWEKPSRPPRGNPPHPTQAQTHMKSESASTAAHYGLGISNSSSNDHGIDAMSTTHESEYVTAPQSFESGGRPPSASPSPSPRASAAAGISHSTHSSGHVQRFRLMNPDLSRSPSPRQASFPNRTPQLSISSQKELPSTPGPSSNSNPIPSIAPVPDRNPHTKRPSSVSSSSSTSPPPPAREKTSTGSASSSRRSHTPEASEEPEAYFVRNTYAQLDVTGVKGDGYEEGVERTRAKLGHDRRSVQLAVRNEARGDIIGDLSDEELRILKTVDRYGFFNAPSHDRVVILPASSLSKSLQPMTHTGTSGPPSPPVLTSEPRPRTVSKELESKRVLKWSRMLEAEQRDCGGNVTIWRIRSGKEKKFRSRVFKGIPDAWRSAAWEVLVARWVAKKKFKKPSLDARSLEGMLNDLRREYRSSLDRPSSYDVQIDLDVPRTISGHVLFKTRYGQGQRSLFHTLHSFSLVCNECGYCQGMGPLAATLLCYYEPEKVYAFLVHFHDEYEMHDIFLPGFPGLLETIYVQERIMERMLPTVYASFKKHMISTTSYATKWYITLFANTVPFQTQLRLWDAFLLEGRDVFVIVAVAIVWVLRDHLTSAQANFETVLSLLSSFFVPEDEDAFLKWIDRALDDKKLRGDMSKWRTEWRGLVAEKKEAGALM